MEKTKKVSDEKQCDIHVVTQKTFVEEQVERTLELKQQIKDGTLEELPFKHPSSKHAPDQKCETCLGTGYKLKKKDRFAVLTFKYAYKDCFAFFCECTFFNEEDTTTVKEMFGSLNGG